MQAQKPLGFRHPGHGAFDLGLLQGIVATAAIHQQFQLKSVLQDGCRSFARSPGTGRTQHAFAPIEIEYGGLKILFAARINFKHQCGTALVAVTFVHNDPDSSTLLLQPLQGNYKVSTMKARLMQSGHMAQWFFFSVIYVYLTKCVFVPFWKYSKMQNWDIPGHVQAAWFIKNISFPWYEGWNPFFFAGHPNDTYYGPLYHYVLALMNFVMPMEQAFKVLTIFSIGSLPLAMYYFAKKLGFTPTEASIQTFLMMIPMAFINIAAGGTLYSMFMVGLVSNALAFPLFFLYYGKLHETVTQFSTLNHHRRRLAFIELSIALALIVLLHFVVCFAALMVLGVYTIYYIRNKTSVYTLAHGIVSLLLCGFWLGPLIAYKAYVENTGTLLNMGFFVSLPLYLLVVFGFALAAYDHDTRFDPPFFILLATFGIAAYIDFGEFGLPMHSYRFIPFFLTLMMMGSVKYFSGRNFTRSFQAGALVAFVLLFAFYVRHNLTADPRDSVNKNRLFVFNTPPEILNPHPDLGPLTGRILLNDEPSERKPRLLEHYLAQSTGKAIFTVGLFQEGAPNGLFLASFKRTVQSFIKRNRYDFTHLDDREKIQAAYIKKVADAFGIHYLLSHQPIKGLPIERLILLRQGKPPYALQRISVAPIIEPISTPFKRVSPEKWREAVKVWKNSAAPTLYIEGEQAAPILAPPGTVVQNMLFDWKQQRFSFDVLAPADVPVLVKVAYFPRWKAWHEHLMPLHIYQASPALMLVYTHGTTTFEYGLAGPDYLGILCSLLAMGLILALFIKTPRIIFTGL